MTSTHYAFVGKVKPVQKMFVGEPGLIFNAYIRNGDCDLLIAGLRFCRGRIYPPASRNGNRWHDVAFLNRTLAGQVFTALKQQYEETYPSLFAATDMERAIKPVLTNQTKLVSYIPEIRELLIDESDSSEEDV